MLFSLFNGNADQFEETDSPEIRAVTSVGNHYVCVHYADGNNETIQRCQFESDHPDYAVHSDLNGCIEISRNAIQSSQTA